MSFVKPQSGPGTVRQISEVEADEGFVLNILWMDGDACSPNLTGLIHRSRHFKRFLEDPEAFLSVRVDEGGTGVEWENGLDYSAEQLWRMAHMQAGMSAGDLDHWQKTMDLSNQEAADILGMSLSGIKKYRSGAADIPARTALACAAIAAEPSFIDFLYIPRTAGRPMTAAAAEAVKRAVENRAHRTARGATAVAERGRGKDSRASDNNMTVSRVSGSGESPPRRNRRKLGPHSAKKRA